MSLEELLKDRGSSSAWSAQYKNLAKFGLVCAVIAVLATAVGFALWRFRPSRTPPSASKAGSEEAAHLERLMRLRAESDQLRRSLPAVREPAGIASGSGRQGRSAVIVSYDPGDGFTELDTRARDIYIPTGAVFQAQLITPIKTSVEKTFVMAETRNEYRMDMRRRIPLGSRLIGRSHFDPLLKGVVVEFDTVVFPNGIESSISALALSSNALPELEGLYFSNKLVNYGTALAFGFLSGFADAGRERQITALGPVPTASVGNQVLAGLSTASFQVANQILSDIRNSSVEYVVVPAGEQVFVVLTRRYTVARPGGAP